MTISQKINLFIAVQLVLVAIAFAASQHQIFLPVGISVLGFFEACLLFCFYWTVSIPVKKLSQLLNLCLKKNDSAVELLRQGAGKAALGKEINTLVSNCLAQATKANYTLIHDKQAELAALQSQINPHFLYNILDSIRGQALIDNNKEIAMMVKALADFFRYSISRRGEMVTLREELANVKNYMTIQQYRFDNRFSLQIVIAEEDEIAYDFLIPKLIIQPIVENAIYHGLKNTVEGGVITIEINRTERNLILMISDNGEGMDFKSLEELNKRIKSPDQFYNEVREDSSLHSGIALPNIHKRIQLLFGEEYGLQVYSTQKLGTDVEILLPSNYERMGEHED